METEATTQDITVGMRVTGQGYSVYLGTGVVVAFEDGVLFRRDDLWGDLREVPTRFVVVRGRSMNGTQPYGDEITWKALPAWLKAIAP